MFSRTLAFGIALSTLAAATSATAQVQQASPQQPSPQQPSPWQATPLANIPPPSSVGTPGISLRVQPQNDINGITGTAAPNNVGVTGIITANPSGSVTGVQSGAESVSPAPLFAPVRRPVIHAR